MHLVHFIERCLSLLIEGGQLFGCSCPHIFFFADCRYPSRPDTKVLNNVSFTVAPGTSLALVGGSGRFVVVVLK